MLLAIVGCAPVWFALFFTQPAAAVDLAVGGGAAVQFDLPDRAGGAGLGAGPALHVPVLVGLGPAAALRFVPEVSFGWGAGRVSWDDPSGVRYVDDGAQLVVAGVGLGIGAEARLPVEVVRPYFGATLGLGWYGTWYGLDGAAAAALVPADAQVGPRVGGVVPSGALALGLRPELAERVALQVETGYSVAFLGARGLTGAIDGVDARREAVGLNAIRFGLGLLFSL
jgi:hypothetical protein